jgi:carboxyl-terminal processing protease
MKFKINLSTLALSLLMITESLARKSEEFYEGVTRLNKVLNDVNRKYVEEVDTEDLVNSAIEGLRDVLDPHTAVFSPKDYDNLKVSTDGEFGGLGITIAIREKVLTIISPLQGTPAFKIGLQAGDKIVKIDGESTKSISINDAVDKLRGKIGTDVTISIVRSGHIEIMDFTITRDKIVIHSVPYSGMLNHDIGYIKVAQFAKNTGRDVKFAIEKLQSQGMKKLILDLRYNPGGLLSQAIEVSDLFLDKGKVIVSTKGRTQQSEARAENKALVDPRIPIVTLINEGSASASEIVSGAFTRLGSFVTYG